MWICFLVHPPTDTRVLSMNKDAKRNDSINCHMQVLVWLFGFIFLGFIPREKKILGHMVTPDFSFLEDHQAISRVFV